MSEVPLYTLGIQQLLVTCAAAVGQRLILYRGSVIAILETMSPVRLPQALICVGFYETQYRRRISAAKIG